MKLSKILERLPVRPFFEVKSSVSKKSTGSVDLISDTVESVGSEEGQGTVPPFEFADIEIKGCYIGDLLSNVMAHAQAGDLWLTVQTHQNVVAIAQLLNLGGVVFLEGYQPQEDTVTRARQEKIPLFVTNDSAYEFASRLSKLGLEREAK